MRNKLAAVVAFAAFISAAPAYAVTIETHETERYFFKDGKYTRFDGQFEHSYFFDAKKNMLIRTRTYDYQSKRVTSENTAFYVQRTLNSHPTNADNFGLLPVVRAVGRPDPDTLEILMIEDETVQSAISTGTSLIVSRSKRLK